MAKKRIPKKIIKIVQGYTQRLSKEEKLSIEKVIIFGSQAKGKPHQWSDIDVCLISPSFKDFPRDLEFLWQRRKDEEVMAGLEPIGFSKKDFKEGGALVEEIKRTGFEVKNKRL